MVSTYLDVDEPLGLTSVIAGDVTLEQAMTTIDEGRIDVLSSGPIPSNPSELLGSVRMSALLAELGSTHDIVIVDAPPVLPVADALVLAGEIDAVVLVTKVGETTRERLKQAAEAVLQVRGNLVGIVPNAVVQREDSAYAYAYRHRPRKGADSLTLYTKQARTPEIDVSTDEFVDREPPSVAADPVVTAPEPVAAAKRRAAPKTAAAATKADAADDAALSPEDKQRQIAERIQAAFAAASGPDAASRP
jgi:capsular exopolysaccharide synthesis family protein